MTKAARAGGLGENNASRPPVGGPPHGAKLTHEHQPTGHAAFVKSAFARRSASTGHFLQRDEERQHFFLTLPFFMSLRTVSAGDLGAFFLPNRNSR